MDSIGAINPIARAYIEEALNTYRANCPRATAVMVGAATEIIVLDIRDALKSAITQRGRKPHSDLDSFKISRILDVVQKQLEMQKQHVPPKLFEALQYHWPAFTQQVRAARNDADHPAQIDPVTDDAVHGSLLIFPELVRIAAGVLDWIPQHYQ